MRAFVYKTCRLLAGLTRLFPHASIIAHETDMLQLDIFDDATPESHGFVRLKPRDKWLVRVGASAAN